MTTKIPVELSSTPGIADSSNATAITIDSNEKIIIGDTASHVDDLLQIETPASGGGHGIQIRRNDSNSDQGIGRILFGNNTDTDLATISAKTDGANDSGAITFSTQATGGASTEAMRINSDGVLLVGTTTAVASTVMTVSGGSSGGNAPFTAMGTADNGPAINARKTSTTTSSDARFIQFSANSGSTAMGAIVGNGASNAQFITLSDEREKENITSVESVLDKVMNLNVVSFDWIKHDEHIKAGFIAQNVEKYFPEYVVENVSNEGEEERKGTTGGMSAGYVAVLTKAIQEQQTQIEALQYEICTLKGE